MKLILLHILVYAFVYIASVSLIMGIMGVINLVFRKPFRDRWRHNLFHVAVVLVVGMLIDLIPRRLLFAVGLPAGVLLLAGAIWFFIKYLNNTFQRGSVAWKHGKNGGIER